MVYPAHEEQILYKKLSIKEFTTSVLLVFTVHCEALTTGTQSGGSTAFPDTSTSLHKECSSTSGLLFKNYSPGSITKMSEGENTKDCSHLQEPARVVRRDNYRHDMQACAIPDKDWMNSKISVRFLH